mmetsp:Transcript_60351/g.67525  ORF Transcript_60351/g.67525 Transcript_60351/m.67525 type:complete len:343 (+) Transcript_60351:37-1065(+)|eukprot:CAMPEP_0170787170 /NCGR_PEP_ID=MMETSP0733-20121128/18135_1 /TAXON_ID=186038 /ORGANISM="Fragilariopsis kerguelensis, Strain L26-C5" /LENGTH=342 /DNA_ID=CAMNT_0011133349 /DNA_START=37 /DNA_END=1065 /DNA_ORIENTATION=+
MVKRSARTCTWSLSLLLMIGGSSLLWNTARRSVSKKGRVLFVNAFSGASPPANAGKRNRENPVSTEPSTTTSDASNDNSVKNKESDVNDYDDDESSPWNNPDLAEQAKRKKSVRARQHVNPLARKFQQPTVLSVNWPQDVFQDLSKPLLLDIGCSRGGFLIDMASERPDDYNYLGLEIRPIVVYHAKERIAKHNLQGRLDFVGCNANIDLERLLTSLTTDKNTENYDSSSSSSSNNLQMVTIQFPDPHFKSRHSKRRVVTSELVQTLARFMPTGATIFLQSDIQSVLDEMRLQFREHPEYFQDAYESLHEYEAENILGIPTERETSVLERNLPVYRAIFTRT